MKIKVKQIKSTYALGTTDGKLWVIDPRRVK